MKHTAGILLPLILLSVGGLASCGTSSTFDNSTLIIGLECDYAPFNWTESSANDYTLPIYNRSGKYADGYDIQIAKYLSEDLNRPVQIVATPWDSLIADLQFKTINLVIAGMTDTAERRESIGFTDEYYHSELVLVTSAATAAQYNSALSADEFRAMVNGQVIVSQVSTVTNDVIENIFAKDYGAIHATPVATFALAATDVANGTAFAMTAELPVATSIVGSNPSLGIVHIDQNILGETLAELGVSIGVHKDNTELKDLVNASLAKLSSETRVTMMEGAIARSSEE